MKYIKKNNNNNKKVKINKKNNIKKKIKIKGGDGHGNGIVCINFNKSTNNRLFWAFAFFSLISTLCSILQNKFFNRVMGTGCIKKDRFGDPVYDQLGHPLVNNQCFQEVTLNSVINGLGIFTAIISGFIQFVWFMIMLMKM